jgi:hypothetical protein
MSFLDPLIKLLKSPFEAVNKQKNALGQIKGGIKGDINRLKAVQGQYKNAADKAKGVQGQAADAQKSAQAGQQKAGKMGLFSKKKKCPSCGEKLHASWDQCPYCGWSEAAAPAAAAGGGGAAAAPAPSPAGGKMRTMAIDAQSTGGGKSGAAVGWLVPLDGPQAGELFPLKGRAVIGTAADCDVILKDPSISGRHAEFAATSSGFRVNDLGSTNGTYVNDKRVTTSDLIDNDNVKCGRVNFKFKTVG